MLINPVSNFRMSSTNWLISIFELLIVFLSTILLIVYFQYRRRYKFWQQLGVEQLNPIFPVGDLSTVPLSRKNAFIHLQDLYNQFKQKRVQYGGIYFFKGPVFMPIAPDLIKRILVTDFDYFMDRGVFIDKEKLPISGHLLAMQGQEWRNQRAKLTPVFTTSRIKSMYKILQKCVNNLIEILNELDDGADLDMKQRLTQLTTDTIGSTAFGIDCNSLKDPNAEFSQMVDKIFTPSPIELVKLAIEGGLDNPGNIAKLPISNRQVVKFFTDLIENTIKYRDENRVHRDDFINILLKIRDTIGMSMDEIVAQSFLFFTAGFETTSTTISFAIHELAYNQQIQDRLREEIVANLGKDVTKYSYEDVQNLPYLEKVFKETMRKHPAAGSLNRIVVKPYKLPGTNITLPSGIPVVIPFLGLQRDPDYFPNPMEFKPERFNDDNSGITPFTYLPFGDGPRNCIGLRFGAIQTKLAIAALIGNFKFLPGKNSQRELPVDTNTTSLALRARDGVPVKLFKV